MRKHIGDGIYLNMCDCNSPRIGRVEGQPEPWCMVCLNFWERDHPKEKQEVPEVKP